ncbi:MAG TPA: glycosyltransferase family 25 protein [Ensifer sp.]|nr:glycosyltransferase family 25 protein [Ensifer sp.]
MTEDIMPSIPVYVINLDRSADRLAKIERSALQHGIEFIRVAAVDGRSVPAVERHGLSELLFRLRCGRRSLPGEYGCYRSHLETLREIAEGSAPAALVMEDDVEFADGLKEAVRALVGLMPKRAVLKLVHHRSGGFLPLERPAEALEVGVCCMGPQGSTAAYLVTREGARRLLRRLRLMSLPVDVAMERAWSTGVDVLTLRENLLPFMDGQRGVTLVGTSEEYRSVKFFKLARVPSYLFKGLENIWRMAYALLRAGSWHLLSRLRG